MNLFQDEFAAAREDVAQVLQKRPTKATQSPSAPPGIGSPEPPFDRNRSAATERTEVMKIDDPKDAKPSETGVPDAPEFSNTSKDPANWVTGDEPMTGAQNSYLRTLYDEVGVA